MTDARPTDPTDGEGRPPAQSASRPGEDTAAAVFRTALRDVLVLLGLLAVLGTGIGALVAGTAGVWGALIGVGLALLFSGTTIVSMLRTAHSTPQKMAAAVMGAWLAKVIVVIVALAVLSRMDFYSRPVLAIVLAVGVLGSAVADYRAVSRARVPYVQPAGDDSSEQGQPGAM